MRASAALLLLLAPSVVRAQLTCGNASIEARTLRYCTGGSAPVTVVFESDIGRGATAWDSTATRVLGFARVVTYDRAGTGGSPAAPGGRSPTDIAADLRRLLDQIGEPNPVVLAGHAEGSWFVRAFAQLYPSRVRALVLIDPPHEEFEARAAALLSPADRAARDSSEFIRAAALSPAGHREREGIRAAAAGEWARPLPDVPLLILSVGRHPWVPVARAIDLEAQWQELATALAARVPNGRTQLVAQGDADLPLTRPDVIASAVREIVTRSTPPKASSGFDVGEFVKWLLGLAATVAGIVVTYRLTKPGTEYNRMQIEKARREAAREVHPEPDPHQVGLWDLISRDTPPAGRAVALVHAANARAVEVYRARMLGAPADARANRIWNRTWPDEDWNAQRAWVEPYDSGPGREVSLTQDVLHLLRGPGSRQVWVVGPAGAGKSTFMNRLFFEALGVAGAPARVEPGLPAPPPPMFVQARNVGVDQLGVLRTAPDVFAAFITGWLGNRSIEVPAEAKTALIGDFRRAIGDGHIALFIDGFDELVDLGLVGFLHELLERSACWVCAERSDRRLSRTGTSRALEGTWTLDQIQQHLAARWRDKPEWQSRVYPLLRKDTDGEHLIRVPRYLDLFLRLLEKRPALPDDTEIRELLRGGPELASAIVALALERLPRDPNATEHEVNARLFRVAAARVAHADFVLPRAEKDPAWIRVLQMTEIVSHVVTPEGDNVRITHPALVDYFLAGEIASEIRSGRARLTQGDRHWSRGLLAGTSAWLRRYGDPTLLADIWRRIQAEDESGPVTNLLELTVQLDIDSRRIAHGAASERDLRRDVRIADKDLSTRNLAASDLRLVTFERCRFDGANLAEADLQHGTFHDCTFVGAKLSQARAQGAEFARCRFLDPARPDLLPQVDRLLIEAAEFHEGTDTASDIDGAWLEHRGAVRTSTRYGGEFGSLFFRRQSAFLSQAAESLERGAYHQRIEESLARCPAGRPITVIDLMAGGGNEWLASLVTARQDAAPRFPGLRVLGIDRDEPQLRALKGKFPEVFKWVRLEIGPGGLDLPAIAGEVFAGPGQRLPADLIVAKKAIHELRRPLQPELLGHCFAGLRPGGEFVLFADSPGPESPDDSDIPNGEFARIDEDVRRLLLDPDAPFARIREIVIGGMRFTGSVIDQARFCNLWVMVKDWANDNVHEVRNRWFSSAGEIRRWARAAGFEEAAPPVAARYRLAVARFNERGIQRVVGHLERNGPAAIRNDGAMLADWLSASGDERQSLLLELTAHHLTPGSLLAEALGLRSVGVDWSWIHEDMRKLAVSGRETLSFEFPVHVLAFRKPIP